MLEFSATYISIFVLVNAALILLYALYNKEYKPGLGLFYLGLLSIFVYTNFGRFHQVLPTDAEYVARQGEEPKQTYFHFHEIYHYYLGSKYIKELGHTGLYNAVLMADRESADPAITLAKIRDLSSPLEEIPVEIALQRAEVPRQAFTEARWAEFKRDVEYMKSIAFPDWMNRGMHDAGFNAPPTWSIFGHKFANLMPLSEEWADLGPMWDSAELLPLLDVGIIIICCVFLWWAYGLAGMSLFLIIFGTSYISSAHWTGGGFLRFLWLLGFVPAFCLLRKRHFFWAGAFFAFAACMRIFPGIFAVGAVFALLLHYRQKKEPSIKPVFSLIFGGLISAAILIGISISMFGIGAWKDFEKNIMTHKDIFFVGHISYKKVLAFDEEINNQNFSGAQGMDRFRQWNDVLQKRLEKNKELTLFSLALLMVGTLWGMRNIPTDEGALLFGIFAIYFFTMPANYYYIFLSLIPITLYRPAIGTWRNRLLMTAFFAFWVFTICAPHITYDAIVENYYISASLLGLLLLWLFTSMVLRPSYGKKREKTPPQIPLGHHHQPHA